MKKTNFQTASSSPTIEQLWLEIFAKEASYILSVYGLVPLGENANRLKTKGKELGLKLPYSYPPYKFLIKVAQKEMNLIGELNC